MIFRIFALAAAIALLGLGFFARTPDTGGVALRDFEAYYAAGATWHYHGDPYSRDVWRTERLIPGVVATREELLPFVGPPFALPLWDALSRMPWNWAVWVWRAVMVLSFTIIVLASLRLAGETVDVLDLVAALVLGGTFAPLTSGIALGQVAVPACAAIVSFPLLVRVRYAYAAGAGALVAALQPNLAIVLAARLREPRSFIAAAGALALVVGGSIVALQGIGGVPHYLAVLGAHSGSEADAAIQTTVAGIAHGLGATSHQAGIAAATFALAAFAGIASQYFSRRYSANDVLVLACAALPLALPFGHEHDFNIAFLPAVVIAFRATGPARALGIAGALIVSVDWLGLAQRPGSTLEACAFAAAAGLAFAALGSHTAIDRGGPSRMPQRDTLYAAALAAGIATCVALVALPAAHHALPTWPDRLPHGFTAARSLGAAAVWHAEQAAAGITGRDPYWALLRFCSLAGCAVLWAAGSLALSASPNSEPTSNALRPRVGANPSA